MAAVETSAAAAAKGVLSILRFLLPFALATATAGVPTSLFLPLPDGVLTPEPAPFAAAAAAAAASLVEVRAAARLTRAASTWPVTPPLAFLEDLSLPSEADVLLPK
eukprot:CAMPEP_0170407386 /NCGR_PEP_ID=MMETSP0117_2-20130122/28220_1 /TAXON_ID=400756 /ORGANISM="Durinskia baltica, Strain CSIRO CS-38" /LENGTH=105 /DNA_ID=CAMNT_0010664631 /DNA_START=67 /DNA_END=384 /DNA_ORIENTATION=-